MFPQVQRRTTSPASLPTPSFVRPPPTTPIFGSPPSSPTLPTPSFFTPSPQNQETSVISHPTTPDFFSSIIHTGVLSTSVSSRETTLTTPVISAPKSQGESTHSTHSQISGPDNPPTSIESTTFASSRTSDSTNSNSPGSSNLVISTTSLSLQTISSGSADASPSSATHINQMAMISGIIGGVIAFLIACIASFFLLKKRWLCSFWRPRTDKDGGAGHTQGWTAQAAEVERSRIRWPKGAIHPEGQVLSDHNLVPELAGEINVLEHRNGSPEGRISDTNISPPSAILDEPPPRLLDTTDIDMIISRVVGVINSPDGGRENMVNTTTTMAAPNVEPNGLQVDNTSTTNRDENRLDSFEARASLLTVDATLPPYEE